MPGIWLAFQDAKEYILPFRITIPMLAIGILWGGYTHVLFSALLGAVFTFAFLIMTMLIVNYFTGNPGMGGGDVWLAAALGAWFGLAGVLQIFLSACILGIVFSLGKALYLSYKEGAIKPVFKEFFSVKEIPDDMNAPVPINAMPFGTFLVVSAWMSWLDISIF